MLRYAMVCYDMLWYGMIKQPWCIPMGTFMAFFRSCEFVESIIDLRAEEANKHAVR